MRLTDNPDNASGRLNHLGGAITRLTPAAQAVADWHNQNHLGPFSTCTEQPCDAVRRVE